MYVGRPSPFGNPFTVGVDGDAARCVAKFEEFIDLHGRATLGDAIFFHEYLMMAQKVKEGLPSLTGKNQACWCKLCDLHRDDGLPLGVRCLACEPCHADPLLRLANPNTPSGAKEA